MEPFQQQRKDSEETSEATPAARHRAHELNVSLCDVQGTGSNGRVIRDDVEAHAEKFAQGGDTDADAETPSIEPGDGEPAAPGETHPNDQAHKPAEGGVHFRCPTNPDFNLQSRKLGKTIYFMEGCYETSEPAEVAVLRACQFVEEVSG